MCRRAGVVLREGVGLCAAMVTALASRRQNFFLERLGSTTVAGATILSGLLLRVTSLRWCR